MRQQLGTTVDAEPAIQGRDVLVDRVAAQPEPQRHLPLALALQQAGEGLAQPQREGSADAVRHGCRGPARGYGLRAPGLWYGLPTVPLGRRYPGGTPQAEGQQPRAVVDPEVAIQGRDLLVDGVAAQRQPQGDLLFAVPLH